VLFSRPELGLGFNRSYNHSWAQKRFERALDMRGVRKVRFSQPHKSVEFKPYKLYWMQHSQFFARSLQQERKFISFSVCKSHFTFKPLFQILSIQNCIIVKKKIHNMFIYRFLTDTFRNLQRNEISGKIFLFYQHVGYEIRAWYDLKKELYKTLNRISLKQKLQALRAAFDYAMM